MKQFNESVSPDVYKYFSNSYRYYITFEDTDLTDHQFDRLCEKLYKEYYDLSDYEQSLLDVDSLKSGTGYDIPINIYKEVLGV